jgi:hypothetical protein
MDEIKNRIQVPIRIGRVNWAKSRHGLIPASTRGPAGMTNITRYCSNLWRRGWLRQAAAPDLAADPAPALNMVPTINRVAGLNMRPLNMRAKFRLR